MSAVDAHEVVESQGHLYRPLQLRPQFESPDNVGMADIATPLDSCGNICYGAVGILSVIYSGIVIN